MPSDRTDAHRCCFRCRKVRLIWISANALCKHAQRNGSLNINREEKCVFPCCAVGKHTHRQAVLCGIWRQPLLPWIFSRQYNFRGGSLEGQSRKATAMQLSGVVWRNKAGKPQQCNFRGWFGGTKPESHGDATFGGGLEEQNRKAHKDTTFGAVWRGFAPPVAPQAQPPPHTQQISGALSAGKSDRNTIR
jgi:hypothetical protein